MNAIIVKKRPKPTPGHRGMGLYINKYKTIISNKLALDVLGLVKLMDEVNYLIMERIL